MQTKANNNDELWSRITKLEETLNAVRNVLKTRQGIADSQEFGLHYGQLSDFLNQIEDIVNPVKMDMSKHISNVLTLSTSHITAETSELIADEPDNNTFGLAVYEKADFGFWIYCGDKHTENILLNLPEDLRKLIKLAREHHCEWLCLDCDGAEIDGLPTYDW